MLHVLIAQKLVPQAGKITLTVLEQPLHFRSPLSLHLLPFPPHLQCSSGGCGVCRSCLCLNKTDLNLVAFDFNSLLSLLE